MKQGHYVTIEGAFKNYRRNKRALDNYPYPYSAGIGLQQRARAGRYVTERGGTNDFIRNR